MMEDSNASNTHPLITSSSSSPSSSSSSCWASPAVAWEHMFNKVVTPSDVGKLNRLVIPKQHAEKYFPLDRSAGGDKGLLLCFEEIATGKPWRFRYSYWNSSQSYVMTKGWSRFVKEKKLDAGDTVSFARGTGDDSARGRLFIDWRRRPPDPDRSTTLRPLRSVVVPWAGSGSFPPWVRGLPFSTPSTFGCTTRNTFLSNQPIGQEYMYFPTQQPRFQLGGGSRHGTIVLPELLPAEPKRVRLFGVNLESSPEANQQAMQPPNPHQWRLGLPRSETRSGMDLDLHLNENQLDDQ